MTSSLAKPSLSIVLFGSPVVSLNGEPLTKFVSVKARLLLYYLAADPKPHDREKLAVLLWGTKSNAKRNLRDVIYNLRQMIDPYLSITRKTIGLNVDANIVIDHLCFLGLVEQRTKSIDEWLTLLDLYRGEFMEGVWLDDETEYDEWLMFMREHVETRFTESLESAVSYFFEQQHFENVIRFASQLILRQPWSDVGHEKLMLSYALQGLRSKALTQYEIYASALCDEIGVDPNSRIAEYRQQILDGTLDLFALEQPKHNLPARVTPLVGRGDEFTESIKYIDDEDGRLLTLGGPGGVGKTRLALDIAWHFANNGRFEDGVFWVNLIDVSSSKPHLTGRAIAQAIIQALSVPISSQDVEIQLSDVLRDKHLLLILDNFEHLQIANNMISRLLTRTAKTSLIVTSRHWLNISGEFRLTLSGLDYATEHPLSDLSLPATQLFLRQVRALDLPTHYDEDTQAAIQHICQLVDGLPLGIVLAARWARLLSPQQIAEQMSTNLGFLEDSAVDAPERHNSLKAVFNYSWSLLESDARLALSRLSCFRGGFDLAAAGAVGVSLNTLFLLVDCSLVIHAGTAQNKRFDIPVSIRQFSQEKLSIKESAHTREKHSAFYLNWLEEILIKLKKYHHPQILDVIKLDIENLRIAWQWAVAHDRLTPKPIEALFLYFDMRSLFRNGYELFSVEIDKLKDERIRGMLWARSGWFAFHLGRAQGKLRLRKALDMARAQKNTADMTFALQYLSAIYSHNDQLADAREMARQALVQAEKLGDPYYLAIINNILADIGFRQAHYQESELHSQTALSLVQSTNGNLWSKTFSLTNLGRVAKAQLQYDEADSFFHQSLAVREEIGDMRGIALCYQYLGETAVENKQSQAARKYLYMAQSLLQQIGSLREATSTFLHLADLAYNEGEQRDAAHYYGRVLTLSHEFDQKLYLQQALTGFTHIWRENNSKMVDDINLYLQKLQPMHMNLSTFEEEDEVLSSYLIPSSELQPIDLLVTRIMTYLEMN